MKSKEVQEKTGLTRKAIEYYEELSLITPSRDESGYRRYSDDDISTLIQINIFKKLGVSLSDIAGILNSGDKAKTLNNIVRDAEIRHNLDLKKIKLLKKCVEDGSFDNIRTELLSLEAQESIYDRLSDKFPGYLGQMFFLNYAPFLQGKLETDEQKNAYSELVDFLDQMENIPFTNEEKNIILESGDWISTETMESIIEGKIEAIEDPDKWIKENDDIIAQYQAFKKSEEYKALPIIQIFEKIKAYLQQSGYYEVAIPLIRKMSPDYDEYYLKMLNANEKLFEQRTP